MLCGSLDPILCLFSYMCLCVCEMWDRHKQTDKLTNTKAAYPSSVRHELPNIWRQRFPVLWAWRWKTKKSDFSRFLLRHRKLPESCQEQEGLISFWLGFSRTCQSFLHNSKRKCTSDIISCPCVSRRAQHDSSTRCATFPERSLSANSSESQRGRQEQCRRRLIAMLSMYWHFLPLLCKFLWTRCGGCGTGKLILRWLNDGWPFHWQSAETGEPGPTRTRGVERQMRLKNIDDSKSSWIKTWTGEIDNAVFCGRGGDYSIITVWFPWNC